MRLKSFSLVKAVLDQPSRMAEALVKAGRLFSAAAVGNDRLGATLLQLLAQLGAIVGLIAVHVFGRFQASRNLETQFALANQHSCGPRLCAASNRRLAS